ncbi:MAG TPA: DUF4389 domain-containing protein [Patescibacteria group bacterium]
MAATQKIYPHLEIDNNKHPNRLLNFPFIGIFIKLVILIPIFIEIGFLGLVAFFALIINWFVISFTGKYWNAAYDLFLGIMRLSAKMRFYMFGVTDRYPGFTFTTQGILTLEVAKPEKPNRWLAIPLLGIAIRAILLIPYFIFSDVLNQGAGFAMFLSWFVILFKGTLPESFYEFEKDSVRVSLSVSAYLLGLSDEYPSFVISMNHQTVKIALIIIGAILTFFNFFGNLGSIWQSENRIQNENQKGLYNYGSQYNYSPKTYNNNYNTY